MPLTTTNLGLATYNATTDGSALFSDFRAAIAGTGATSNMNKIDTWAGQVNGSLITLSTNKPVYSASAVYVSANYYEATNASISAYSTNMIITLRFDTTTSGTVTLNINALGTKSLVKVDESGNLINFTNNELKKNKEYSFRYNGFQWIWISGTSIDQISSNATLNNLLMTSGCGLVVDSGVQTSASKILGGSIKIDNTLRTTGCSLGLDTSALTANYLISMGSGGSLINGISASSTNFISGSGNSFINNASASNVRIDINVASPLSVAGSQISLLTSGVISGSYNQIEVDSYGRVTAGSVVPSGGGGSADAGLIFALS
jgi:hypothetical protein